MAKKNIKKNAQVIENNAQVIVKEDTTMAESTTINANVEAIEEIAGPKQMLLVTASRGKNTRLAWNVIEVNDDDATQKVKGCAIELPIKAAEIIGNDKFISYIDLSIISRCVEEHKAVRGTASTVSDVFNRYCKVTDTKGERVAVALKVFGTILTAVENGENNGAWVRPEPEKEEAPDVEIEAPAEEN
jgi:hypothetical protein